MKKIILLFLFGLSTSIIFAKPLTKTETQEMLKQFIVFQNAVKKGDAKTVKSMMKLPMPAHRLLLGDSSREKILSSAVFERNKKVIMKNLWFATLIKVNPNTPKDNNYFLDIPNRDYFYDKKGNYCYYVKNNKKIRIKKETPSDVYTVGIAGENENQLFLSKTSVENPCWQVAVQSECGGSAEFLIFEMINGKLTLVDTGVAG